LAAQSRELPSPVLLAGKHDRRRAALDIGHRRVVDRHLLSFGLQERESSLDPRPIGLIGIIRFLIRTLAKVPRIITS
jgi:hypothetical protein